MQFTELIVKTGNHKYKGEYVTTYRIVDQFPKDATNSFTGYRVPNYKQLADAFAQWLMHNHCDKLQTLINANRAYEYQLRKDGPFIRTPYPIEITLPGLRQTLEDKPNLDPQYGFGAMLAIANSLQFSFHFEYGRTGNLKKITVHYGVYQPLTFLFNVPKELSGINW